MSMFPVARPVPKLFIDGLMKLQDKIAGERSFTAQKRGLVEKLEALI